MDTSGFVTIISIVVPALLFLGVWQLWKKGLTVREILFKGNVVLKFEMLAIASTLIEVANLTTIAVERHVPVGAAIGRYVSVGALEIIVCACFIEAFAWQVRKATLDGKVEAFEVIRMFVISIPVLAMATLVTHGIAVLYMESLDIIEAIPTGLIMGQLFNIVIVDSGAAMGGLASAKAAGKLELGALFIIYNTVFLNLIMIPLVLWNEIKKMNAKKDGHKSSFDKGKGKDKEKPDKDRTYDSKAEKAAQVLDLVNKQMSGKS